MQGASELLPRNRAWGVSRCRSGRQQLRPLRCSDEGAMPISHQRRFSTHCACPAALPKLAAGVRKRPPHPRFRDGSKTSLDTCADYRFGCHLRANSCASAIWAGVIFAATSSRFLVAFALPLAAARLNHM